MSSQDIQNQASQLWSQAHEFRAAGQWQQAVVCYSQIIQLMPGFVPAYIERGLLVQEMAGDLQKAMADYETALRIDPQYGMAYYGRSWVKISLGDYEGSLQDAKKGLLLDSKNPGMYFRRIGSAYDQMEKYPEAIEAYNEAIRFNSDKDEGTLYNRGLCYFNMQEYTLALADFNRCLELDPDWAWAFSARGNVYLELKQYDRAIEDCTNAIKYNPNYQQAYIVRAYAHRAMGENEKAKADLKKVLPLTRTPQEKQRIQALLQSLKRGWWDIF